MAKNEKLNEEAAMNNNLPSSMYSKSKTVKKKKMGQNSMRPTF
ncbi:hypothetical protein [Bacillus sinesaloumensis]|nr:hypothetical protein [Bacillus sinesaloumensis]